MGVQCDSPDKVIANISDIDNHRGKGVTLELMWTTGTYVAPFGVIMFKVSLRLFSERVSKCPVALKHLAVQ